MKTEIYIVTKFKEYDSTNEKYTFAEVHPTREAAEKAMRKMIEADVDAALDDETEDGYLTQDETDEIIKKAVKSAILEGDKGEMHDAILYYGDISAYYDIFQTCI